MKRRFLLLFSLFIIGCNIKNNDNFYNIDAIKRVSFEEKVRIGSKKVIPLEDMIGAVRIKRVDSLLFVTLVQRGHYLNIYNLNTYEKIWEGCTMGRGPNELLFFKIYDFGRDNDGRYFWNIDINAKIASKFNIDSSIINNKTCITYQFDIPHTVFRGGWIRGDNDIIVERIDDYQGAVFFSNLFPTDTTILDLIRLNNDETTRNQYSTRIGYFGLYNSELDIMAMEQNSMNQINIVNFRTQKITGLTQDKNLIDWNELTKSHISQEYYSGIDGNNNYFVSIYTNKSYSELYDSNMIGIPSETNLHIFDWEGNPKVQLVVAEDLMDFCFNDDMTIMYGIVDDDEQLYIYDISSLGLNK